MGVSLGELRLALKLLLEASAAWVEGFEARGGRHIAFEVVVGMAKQHMAALELFAHRWRNQALCAVGVAQGQPLMHGAEPAPGVIGNGAVGQQTLQLPSQGGVVGESRPENEAIAQQQDSGFGKVVCCCWAAESFALGPCGDRPLIAVDCALNALALDGVWQLNRGGVSAVGLIPVPQGGMGSVGRVGRPAGLSATALG